MQRVEEHHVLVWAKIIACYIHEVLAIVQYDTLSLRQLLLLEVLEQVLLDVLLQVLRLLQLLLNVLDLLHLHQFLTDFDLVDDVLYLERVIVCATDAWIRQS